jgi:hypothetical protein
MTIRASHRQVRRSSLPLTEQDERDLAYLRSSPEFRRALEELSGETVTGDSVSEAALVHALFGAGLAAVKMAAETRGYAAMAADQAATTSERRSAARRRRPGWADED